MGFRLILREVVRRGVAFWGDMVSVVVNRYLCIVCVRRLAVGGYTGEDAEMKGQGVVYLPLWGRDREERDRTQWVECFVAEDKVV